VGFCKIRTAKELDLQLEEIKKNHVREILKSTPKKAEGARKLDIEQNLLSYFVNKWGL
jgi:transposase-like protein